MPGVLKDWFFTVPWRMQSVLMAALRGCDTARKDDHSKFVTRGLRAVCLNNADPTNSYMGTGIPEDKYAKAFLGDLDSYPLHYVMHTMHAAEIVGYKHPEPKFRDWWAKFYLDMVKGLHVSPETEAQLDVRLGPTPAEPKVETAPVEDSLEDDWARLGRPVVVKKSEEAPAKTKRTKLLNPKATDFDMKEVNGQWDAGTGTSHRKSDYT